MNNKQLIHYLNSGVKVTDGKHIGELTYDMVKYGHSVKPLLYPPDLTKPIAHNGVEEIPLVELAKIEGFNCDSYKINDEGCFCEYSYEFTYRNGSFEIWDTDEKEYTITKNQLLLFDYCYSRRINIWGIDAIDPRTLEFNPYYITSKS